jgi:hypothetical protein
MNQKKPSVVLTGDVHQTDFRISKEQGLYDGTESLAAVEYSNIVREFGLRATLFYSGLTFVESQSHVEIVANNPAIEIGGHTYNCYQPKLIYKLWGRLTGDGNGPYIVQKYDIKKTVQAAFNLGINLKSWRNHSYRFDRYTDQLLFDNGFTHVSNDVNPKSKIYCSPSVLNGKLIRVGVNVWPDHEHLVHGNVTVNSIYKRNLVRSGFQNVVFEPDQWVDAVISMTEQHLNAGRNAIILVHPGCMKTLGNWELFRQLCGRLAHLNSSNLKDIDCEISNKYEK